LIKNDLNPPTATSMTTSKEFLFNINMPEKVAQVNKFLIK
jgi:hypothetical protein